MNQASAPADATDRPIQSLDDALEVLETQPQRVIEEFTPSGARQASLTKELLDRVRDPETGGKSRADDALASLEDRLLWNGLLVKELFEAHVAAGRGTHVVRVFEQADPKLRPELSSALAARLQELITGLRPAGADEMFGRLARAWEQVGDLYEATRTDERRQLLEWHLEYGADFARRLVGVRDRLRLFNKALVEAAISNSVDVTDRLAQLHERLQLRDEELVAAVISSGGDHGERLLALKNRLGLSDRRFLDAIHGFVRALADHAQSPVEQRQKVLDALATWLPSLSLPDGSAEAQLRDEIQQEALAVRNRLGGGAG